LMGLESVAPKPNTSRQRKGHKVYPYLLKKMSITEPDQVWCSDITYIRLTHGFVYLTAVMDWASRYVLSWEVSVTMMHICFYCVMTPGYRTRFRCASWTNIPLFQQHNIFSTLICKIICSAAPNHSTTDDDDIGCSFFIHIIFYKMFVYLIFYIIKLLKSLKAFIPSKKSDGSYCWLPSYYINIPRSGI